MREGPDSRAKEKVCSIGKMRKELLKYLRHIDVSS